MLLREPLFTIAKIIYRLPEPPQKRSRDLEVLAVGLPRSGTDSLHTALRVLGYSQVSHGYDWWPSKPAYSVLYYQFILNQLSGSVTGGVDMRERFFDRVLGEYDATTDIPAAWFATDLLKAYPNAKVILNRRRDLTAWQRSFRESILPIMQSWQYWLASWFDAELFWLVALTDIMHNRCIIRGDFETQSKAAYAEHYRNVEAELRNQARTWLDWSVEDGWEPLSRFLDKTSPSEQFPSGNVASEFAPKLMEADRRRFQRAQRNALIALSISVCSAVWLFTKLGR